MRESNCERLPNWRDVTHRMREQRVVCEKELREGGQSAAPQRMRVTRKGRGILLKLAGWSCAAGGAEFAEWAM